MMLCGLSCAVRLLREVPPALCRHRNERDDRRNERRDDRRGDSRDSRRDYRLGREGSYRPGSDDRGWSRDRGSSRQPDRGGWESSTPRRRYQRCTLTK